MNCEQYRIVSNGLDYHIQWLGRTLILRRPKWYWLRKYTYAGDYVATFSSSQEAQKAIDKCKKKDKSTKQGYLPIKTSIESQK